MFCYNISAKKFCPELFALWIYRQDSERKLKWIITHGLRNTIPTPKK